MLKDVFEDCDDQMCAKINDNIEIQLLKHIKNATLDSMPISSRRPNHSIDNEMDKSDQLACIRYKNQNVLA